MRMVDETREDEVFISRLQEEFMKEDETWKDEVSKIKDDFSKIKKEIRDDGHQKVLDKYKEEISLLQKKLKDSEMENQKLAADLKSKNLDIETMQREIERLKAQLGDENAWRKKIEAKLKEMENIKDESQKSRLETMKKVSDEIVKYRYKRVPDPEELKALHGLVDRIHQSMGYLMILGRKTPDVSDVVVERTRVETEEISRLDTSTASEAPTSTEKKKKKVTSVKKEKKDKEKSLAPADGPDGPITNGRHGDTSL